MDADCTVKPDGQKSPEFGYFKMVVPKAIVFWPLVKGNEDSGNEIVHDVAANIVRSKDAQKKLARTFINNDDGDYKNYD